MTIERQGVCVVVQERQDDDVRWLALVIRQALKLIVSEIERRYDIDSVSKADRKRIYNQALADFQQGSRRS